MLKYVPESKITIGTPKKFRIKKIGTIHFKEGDIIDYSRYD